MRTLAMMALLVLSAPAFAKKPADPCKGVKVEPDKFTGKLTASPRGTIWAWGFFFQWEAKWSEDTAPVFNAQLVDGGIQDVGLATGYELQVLTPSGMVPLRTAAPTPPTPGASQSGVYTSWKASFPLSHDLLVRLSGEPITAIRAQLPNRQADWTVSGGSQKAMTRAFTCLLSLSSPPAN